MSIDSVRTHLGYFDTQEEAARRYDLSAKEFDRPLNFPTEEAAAVAVAAATGRPTEVTRKESAESTSKRKKRPKRTVTPDLTTAPELIYLKCLEKDGSQGASVKVMQPRRRPSKDKGIIMASKIMASKKQKKGVAHPVAVKPGSSKEPLGTTEATPIDSSKATPSSAPTPLSSCVLPLWYSFTPAEFR